MSHIWLTPKMRHSPPFLAFLSLNFEVKRKDETPKISSHTIWKRNWHNVDHQTLRTGRQLQFPRLLRGRADTSTLEVKSKNTALRPCHCDPVQERTLQKLKSVTTIGWSCGFDYIRRHPRRYPLKPERRITPWMMSVVTDSIPIKYCPLVHSNQQWQVLICLNYEGHSELITASSIDIRVPPF